MRNKFFVAMVAIFCVMLGGCGSSGDSSAVSDVPYDESYESDDTFSDDYTDDEYAEDDDVDVPEETVPEEISGIVEMLIHNTTQTCSIQVVSVDPDTGIQHVISEFCLERDNKALYQWADSRYLVRNWFANDFSSMAVDVYLSDTGERHSGWIDVDGNFTDVTEMSGMASEQDFFNTAPVQHRTIGFIGNQFVFYDMGTEEVYSVPMDQILNGSVASVGTDDVSARLLQQVKAEELTCQIDNDTYLADYSATQGSPQSFMMCPETGEMTDYIPEADRCNWSGMLSPDGSMVAFFSEPKAGGSVELYKMSMSDKNPTAIALQENSAVTVDVTTLGTGSLALRPSGYGVVFQTMREEGYCHLLEWK